MSHNKPENGTASPSPRDSGQPDNIPALKLLVTVVNRNKSEYYADYLSGCGANVQMLVQAKGTAEKINAELWGFENLDRTVILSVIAADAETALLEGLSQKFKTLRNGSGIAYTVPLSAVIGITVYRFLLNSQSRGQT